MSNDKSSLSPIPPGEMTKTFQKSMAEFIKEVDAAGVKCFSLMAVSQHGDDPEHVKVTMVRGGSTADLIKMAVISVEQSIKETQSVAEIQAEGENLAELDPRTQKQLKSLSDQFINTAKKGSVQ